MKMWEMVMVGGRRKIVFADSREDVFAKYPQALMVCEIVVK